MRCIRVCQRCNKIRMSTAAEVQSPAHVELRKKVYTYISRHWAFGQLRKPITIPNDAIDPLTGSVNHYSGEVAELRTSGVSYGHVPTIWFKKKDHGYELRLGPAVVYRRCADLSFYIPAVDDILVGEVERNTYQGRGRGGERARYIAWHSNAGPMFVFASFLSEDRKPVEMGKLREAIQLPNTESRDDLWIIARLALFPGGVEYIISQELKPQEERELLVTDKSPLRFAFQLAFHFNDPELRTELTAASQRAGITSNAPQRTKRARAPDDQTLSEQKREEQKREEQTTISWSLFALESCA